MSVQRRPYFGVSDGEGTGAKPAQAMPFTGTGTDMMADQFEPQQDSAGAGAGMGAGDPMQEDPNTLRRRLMPIAGNAGRPTDALAVMRQALAAPKPPTWGGY